MTRLNTYATPEDAKKLDDLWEQTLEAKRTYDELHRPASKAASAYLTLNEQFNLETFHAQTRFFALQKAEREFEAAKSKALA